ncbi:Poly(glycerol-phosphate) alpha-glucosyltransferase [Minicystis rosea]|nr:Poly(glycerol-phosphate) alpha-glucosyltransferase [Minicystis rosea]
MRASSNAGPVKVVHVVLGLDVGGLERMLLRLLAHTDRERFAPVVCTLDAPGVLAPELARLGVPLTEIRRRPGLDARLPWRLAQWLKREGARIVHTHNPSPHFYGALAARIARGPRVVHTKHGRNAPEIPRKVLLNRIAAKLSDRVVAVSDDTAGVALDIERVNPRKIVTILNGVDTHEFRPGRDVAAARVALGVPAHGFHVGCVARLAEVKDHRTLLQAFARFRLVRPDAHLTFIGRGPEQADLEARAAEPDLRGAVTFAGERGEVAPLYAAFDVFALASRSEGISLTLLEAAAAGLPIVATRVGGNGEVVADGRSGILVPPADPIAFANALADVAARSDRADLGAAGRARVEQRFSAERMARAYHALYAELLGIR